MKTYLKIMLLLIFGAKCFWLIFVLLLHFFYWVISKSIKNLDNAPHIQAIRLMRWTRSSERSPAEWIPPVEPWKPYTKHHPSYQPYSN